MIIRILELNQIESLINIGKNMNRLKIFITSLLMLSIASSAMASPAYEYSRRAPANSLATLFSPKTGEKTVVFLRDTETIKKLFALDFKLFTKADELSSNGQLGISLPTIVAVFQTSLASKLTSSATSTMTLVSGTTADGSTLSGYYAFILDEGSSNQEFITATCSNTTCTGLTRGISVVDGKTSVTALKKDHGRGASVKITNYPQLTLLTNIFKGTETIDNVMLYGSGITTSTFTNPQQIPSVGYINNIAISGSPLTGTSTPGIGKISSAPISPTNPIFLNSEEVYTTSTANGVVRANGSGKIATSFIDQSAAYTWTNTSTFSGNINATGSVNTFATSTFSGLTKVPTSTPSVAGQIVGLDSSAKLPAVDGSQLTNKNSAFFMSYAPTLFSGDGNKYGNILSTTGTISGTESLVQMKFPAMTFSKMIITTPSNTLTNALPITLRKNAIATALTISVPGNSSSTTSTASSVSFADGDLVSIHYAVPAGGGSISGIIVSLIANLLN